jgi:hypothetical protein
MAKLKLGLSHLSVSSLLLKATNVVTSMTGNPDFPAPVPTLVVIDGKIAELTAAANEAANRDKVKVAIRNLRRSELKSLLVELASYIQTQSGGDEDKILSTGFEVVRRGEPVGPLSPPAALVARTGEDIGTVSLLWYAVTGAHSYMVERNDTDPINEELWKPEGYTTSSHGYVSASLQTGHVYWYRVRAIGAAGVGAQSDPARGVAA